VLAGLVDDNTIDPLLSPTALASPTAPDTPAHPSHASFTALPVECLPNMHNTLPAQSSLASPTLIPTSSLNSHPMVTGAKTRSLKPRSFLDYTALYSTKHPLIALTSILPFVEPSCYTKVVLRPEWRAAMGLEFDALLANGTWSLCPRPLHQHIVRNKWVYKIKHQQDGSIEHFKARLVAKGFDQKSGVDFHETFSPVIKQSTVHVVLTLAVHFDWCIRQLDVSNAFLHGYLAEAVFMEQPKGFVDASHPNYVCHLHKAIYGLKQEPHA